MSFLPNPICFESKGLIGYPPTFIAWSVVYILSAQYVEEESWTTVTKFSQDCRSCNIIQLLCLLLRWHFKFCFCSLPTLLTEGEGITPKRFNFFLTSGNSSNIFSILFTYVNSRLLTHVAMENPPSSLAFSSGCKKLFCANWPPFWIGAATAPHNTVFV